MSLTLMMAATVENSVIVMHAPLGCGSQLHSLSVQVNNGKIKRGKPGGFPAWLSTNLQESDVIGGGERKLAETIEYADREFRPEIIFVVSTCAPSIIGDDVEEIVRQAQKNVAANVVSLHCPGFKSRIVASAYDSFYHGLLKHVPFEPIPYVDYTPLPPTDPNYEMSERRYAYKKSRTVNLWNATSIGLADEDELIRLLKALDLNVQVYAEYSNVDEFRLVSQAALNVSMCNVHDDYMLSYLEEKYGTPYLIAGMPIGFESTRKWLVAVAEHFGLAEEANRLADYEEKLAKEAIAPYLPKIAGKRALICGGVVRVGAEAVALADLGLDVIGIRAYHYDNNAEPIYEDVAENLPDTPIAVSNQLFEMTNQIRTLKPDIMISHGGTHGWIAKLGVPSVQLFSTEKAYFGYGGLFSILRQIVFAFDNTSYQERLAKHIKPPYRDSWFEKDAFDYIKEPVSE
jgi:nitrogenase molybdenum-iron protein alpha chain